MCTYTNFNVMQLFQYLSYWSCAWGVAACWDDGILPAKAAQVFGLSGDNKEDKSIKP